jgi:hypothetical protein
MSVLEAMYVRAALLSARYYSQLVGVRNVLGLEVQWPHLQHLRGRPSQQGSIGSRDFALTLPLNTASLMGAKHSNLVQCLRSVMRSAPQCCAPPTHMHTCE